MRRHRAALAVRVAAGGVVAAGCVLLPVALADRSHGTTWIAHTPVVERIGRTAGEFAVGPLARWSWLGQGLVMFAGLAAIALVALSLGRRGEQRRHAVLAGVIGGLVLVRHIPSAGRTVGCRRFGCMPTAPPAWLTSPANAVRLRVAHPRVGDYAVARWSLRHPGPMTPRRVRLAYVHDLDPHAPRRVLVLLQDPRA